MSYLDEIAKAIRDSVPEGAAVPNDSHELFVLYAVLARACGERVTARDVHDAWTAWMGMKDPSHPSLVPFEKLPTEVQSEDVPFVVAIKAVASRREPRR